MHDDEMAELYSVIRFIAAAMLVFVVAAIIGIATHSALAAIVVIGTVIAFVLSSRKVEGHGYEY